MYITLEADYAVRIVNCLAKNGSRMDAKALSAATGVTLRFSPQNPAQAGRAGDRPVL